VVLNKVDMSISIPEDCEKEIEKTLGISKEQILRISAKTGLNVEKLL